jgi:hypothetical protein
MSWMGGCARDSVKLGSTLDCDSYRTTTPHRATAQVEYQRQADQTKPTEGGSTFSQQRVSLSRRRQSAKMSRMESLRGSVRRGQPGISASAAAWMGSPNDQSRTFQPCVREMMRQVPHGSRVYVCVLPSGRNAAMAHSGVRSARKKYPSENPTRKARTMFIPGLDWPGVTSSIIAMANRR